MEEPDSPMQPLNVSRSTVICMDCSMCEQRAETVNKHMASTLRKMYLIVVVTSVLCVLTLTTCGCTVYMYMQFQTAREELGAHVQQDSNTHSEGAHLRSDMLDESTSIDDTHVDQELYEGSGIQKRDNNAKYKGKGNKNKVRKGGKDNRRRGKRNQCKCCIRKIRSLIKSGEITISSAAATVPTTPAGKANDDENQSNMLAVHYASYVDNDLINKTFPPFNFSDLDNTVLCQHMPSLNGVLCRNRTFSVSRGSPPLNIFRESNWLGNSTSTKLFNNHKGEYSVVRAGLYLLYAHVVFYRNNTDQAFSLVHGQDGVQKSALRCETSDVIHDSHLTVGQNINYKTCSATSITTLKAGDTISLVSLHADTHLDLTTGTTYIGAICIKCPTAS